MRVQTESNIQAAFFEWLSLHEKKYPELSLAYAIPNGAHKSIAARMKFKREGLKAGVPDVHLPVARFVEVIGEDKCGLWIEFKSGKGRVSPIQNEWHERLTKENHFVIVTACWMEAANTTMNYLNLPMQRFKGATKTERPSIAGKGK